MYVREYNLLPCISSKYEYHNSKHLSALQQITPLGIYQLLLCFPYMMRKWSSSKDPDLLFRAPRQTAAGIDRDVVTNAGTRAS